jgi:hypothetical protein
MVGLGRCRASMVVMTSAADEGDEVGTADHDHELLEVTAPLWQKYEQDVADFVSELDPAASVQHNQKQVGKVSKRLRQIDVLVTGVVAGHQLTIAIECKRYKNTIGIGTVDEFAGKLTDLGVDRGVLYAFSGFGSGAIARAAGAIQPRIEIRDLSHPLPELPSWAERVPEFTGFGDCPNVNCFTGDIGWRMWPQQNSDTVVEAGSCDTCGTWAVRCFECGEESGFFGDGVDCDGCERVYTLVWDRKGGDVEDVVVN